MFYTLLNITILDLLYITWISVMIRESTMILALSLSKKLLTLRFLNFLFTKKSNFLQTIRFILFNIVFWCLCNHVLIFYYICLLGDQQFHYFFSVDICLNSSHRTRSVLKRILPAFSFCCIILILLPYWRIINICMGTILSDKSMLCRNFARIFSYSIYFCFSVDASKIFLYWVSSLYIYCKYSWW